MASGLPDYQKSVRPRYGGLIALTSSTVVGAHAETQLLSVTGKGMIYGGCVFLDYTSSQKFSYVDSEIDGGKINTLHFDTLNKYNISKAGNSIISLSNFDDANFRYCVGISYGFTFETSVRMLYTEGMGTTPTVYCKLCYALIT